VKVYALLLAGGAGTRFWPASRVHRPKQLLALTGEQSMLLATAERVLPIAGGWSNVLVAGGRHLEAATREALPELPRENLLLEPVPRNTAPCIAWAAARIARTDPDALVMALPSDHHVRDDEAFRETVRAALASAATGVVTTIGVKPTRPETGFGYIEVAGAPPDGVATPVRRFVEKPNRAHAAAFVESGRYLWNAGMFFFRAKDLVAAVRAHLPALGAMLDRLDEAARLGDEGAALDAAFAAAPNVSLDVGVMEKLDRIAVVPGDFGWSDVGSWQAAWDLAPRDDNGNAAPASAILIDARDNLVIDLRSTPTDRTSALIGVRGMVLVLTDDAVLLLPRERAQEVRTVVEALRKAGRNLLT
jgi:mannose-1-phosphate guanylyltransferase